MLSEIHPTIQTDARGKAWGHAKGATEHKGTQGREASRPYQTSCSTMATGSLDPPHYVITFSLLTPCSSRPNVSTTKLYTLPKSELFTRLGNAQKQDTHKLNFGSHVFSACVLRLYAQVTLVQ